MTADWTDTGYFDEFSLHFGDYYFKNSVLSQ